MNNNKTGLEVIEKYKAEIKQAVVNAVKSTRSCVLFYRDVYYELEEMFDDEETFRRVESALWEFLDGLKLDNIRLYKIYVDPDESFREVVVATFDRELTEEQVRVLEEVASLLSTDFYDRYGEADGQFYDATPLYFYDRTEVYTVLHNLVRMWTGCGGEEVEEQL